MGNPWEKTPDHLQEELGLSHMWPELGSNPQLWNEERFRALKISVFNHSTPGAAPILFDYSNSVTHDTENPSPNRKANK